MCRSTVAVPGSQESRRHRQISRCPRARTQSGCSVSRHSAGRKTRRVHQWQDMATGRFSLVGGLLIRQKPPSFNTHLLLAPPRRPCVRCVRRLPRRRSAAFPVPGQPARHTEPRRANEGVGVHVGGPTAQDLRLGVRSAPKTASWRQSAWTPFGRLSVGGPARILKRAR